jgi:hypothetical protein
MQLGSPQKTKNKKQNKDLSHQITSYAVRLPPKNKKQKQNKTKTSPTK